MKTLTRVRNGVCRSGLYKVSEMAWDLIELLQHVEWLPKQLGSEDHEVSGTNARSGINVVGVSMGGMIALELVRHSRSPRYRGELLIRVRDGGVRRLP